MNAVAENERHEWVTYDERTGREDPVGRRGSNISTLQVASVRGGNLSVFTRKPKPSCRGRACVSLSVWGARYPYHLTADEARTLAHGLLDAATALDEELGLDAATEEE